jgi:hypothetical protein
MVNCRPLSSGEACWSFSRAPGASEDTAPRGGLGGLKAVFSPAQRVAARTASNAKGLGGGRDVAAGAGAGQQPLITQAFGPVRLTVCPRLRTWSMNRRHMASLASVASISSTRVAPRARSAVQVSRCGAARLPSG